MDILENISIVFTLGQTFVIICFMHPSLEMYLCLGLMWAAVSKVSANITAFKKQSGDWKTYTNMPGGIGI